MLSSRVSEAMQWFLVQEQEFTQLSLVNILQILQSAILAVGVAAGTCVCVFGVIADRLTVGDTVLFLALMAQLVSPLNGWASYYRQVDTGRVDMWECQLNKLCTWRGSLTAGLPWCKW